MHPLDTRMNFIHRSNRWIINLLLTIALIACKCDILINCSPVRGAPLNSPVTIKGPQCPSSDHLVTLAYSATSRPVNLHQNVNINCFCSSDSHSHADGWEITCIEMTRDKVNQFAATRVNESSDALRVNNANSPSRASAASVTSPPPLYTLQTSPLAFTIKNDNAKSVEITCDTAVPDFKPAMFQGECSGRSATGCGSELLVTGFSLDEVETFRFVDCPLPSIPLSVILHRTSIKVVTPHNDSSFSDSDSMTDESSGYVQREIVSEVKSLRIQYTNVVKMSPNHLKTLFNGLDSLEKLSLRNVHIDLSSTESNGPSSLVASPFTVNSNDASSKLIGPSRVFISRFKRSTFTSSLISLTDEADVGADESTNNSSSSSTTSADDINVTESMATPFVSMDESEVRSHSIVPAAASTSQLPNYSTTVSSVRERSSSPATSNQGHGSNSRTQPVSLHVRFTSKPSSTSTTTTTTEAAASTMSTTTTASPSIVSTIGTRHSTTTTTGSTTSAAPLSTTAKRVIDEPLVVDLSKDKVPFDLTGDRSSVHRTTQSPFASKVDTPSIDLRFGELFPKLKSLQLDTVFPVESKMNPYALKELLRECRVLENVQLTNNQITSLLDHTFNSSSNSLKRIYLIANAIRQLEPSAFAFLKSLQILDLFNNNLTTILPGSFRDLSSLTMLRIAKNSFATLPDDLLDYSPQIKSVNFALNRNLTTVPGKLLASSSNLQNLSLVDCNLQSLTSSSLFKNAPSIESIELRGNKLTELTLNGLFSYNYQLTRLDISYNNIETISPSIFSSNSSNLMELNLYGNNIVTLDSSMFVHLKNLRILRLGFNNFQSISSDLLFSLRKLEQLDLSRNQLLTINSQLSRLPFGLGTANLRKINLSRNNLTDFNEFAVIDWSLYLKISEINLSGNKINGRIVLPVFHSTSPHVVLDLTSNNITSINMQDIVSYENAVADITKNDEIASDLRSYNYHRDASSQELRSRKVSLSQTIIRLDRNPLKCDCLLESFIDYANVSANDMDSITLRGILNRVSFDFYSPQLKCSSGVPLHQVNRRDLTCKIYDNSLCPNSCSCVYRSYDESVTVDCSNKGLQQIPESIVMPAKYTNLTLDDPLQSKIYSTVSTSNSKSGPLSSHNSASVIVKKVTLLLKDNQIESVDILNTIVIPSSFTVNENNLKSRVKWTFIAFELYLDNNRIESLPEHFLVSSSHQGTHREKVDEMNFDEDNVKSIATSSASSSSATIIASVSVLSLRGNQLSFIPYEVLTRLATMSNNSLSNDNISFQSDKLTPTSASRPVAGVSPPPSWPPTLKLYLGDNPYNCTAESDEEAVTPTAKSITEQCGQLYFKNWLTQHFNLVGDVQDVQCTLPITSATASSSSSSSSPTVQIISAADSDLCPISETSGFFVFSIICLILSSILVVISAIYHRNRQTVLAFMYIHINPIFVCLNLVDEDDLDQDKLYDAFVSYSSADRDIVMEMISRLEEPSDLTQHSISFLKQQSSSPSIHEGTHDQIVPEHAVDDGRKAIKSKAKSTPEELPLTRYYTLCIHERDWLPGNLISWNIVNSVQNSRRTILIISKEFLRSIWFQVEFHTAYYQMLEDQMDRLIVIVKGDLPPKEEMDKDLVFLLTIKTYLVWGEKWFWEKLRYALPHSKRKETVKVSTQRSKADIMRDYVDQTINDHFQLQSRKNGKTPHINRAFVGETQA